MIKSILHISDTHGMHRRLTNLPAADVLVHSGDFTMVGSENEAIDFLNWFCSLPSYRHKVFICGNHDDCLYGMSIDGLADNVHYLCNSSITIDGIKFYGVPMFMTDCVSERQLLNYANISADTDVLVTHAPPYGILDFDDDIHYGASELLSRVVEVAPRLHLFGHIHSQHGKTSNSVTLFSNGSIMDADYSNLHAPNLLEM